MYGVRRQKASAPETLALSSGVPQGSRMPEASKHTKNHIVAYSVTFTNEEVISQSM